MERFLFPLEFVAAHGRSPAGWGLDESLAYTRWLTRAHYENVPIVSLLLPRRLHQDFFNVYAFCRWADDLGDETGDPQRSLDLLDWWRQELDAVYAGEPRHPVYQALGETIRRHGLPQAPFADLIRAFVQDQKKTRYADWDELLAYCAWSANPVGRLVLHLCGYTDAERRRLSDSTCTALQLANFWQDVARDWAIGRVYLPLDGMARQGYSAERLATDVERRQAAPELRSLLAELVDRTARLFDEGAALPDSVDRRLAVDLDLFTGGGRRILEKVRRQSYDVIRERPRLTKGDRFELLIRAVWRALPGARRRRPAPHPSTADR